MGNLQNVVLFVVLLGVLITVHELGHFLIAKALNVKVLRFSVGFGPKIVGFTRGETEYRIAWLPLGGYVKMAGELPHDEVNPEDAKRGFLAQPPWKRALIVVGGPAFNLIFPILVYFFVFVGDHQRPSTLIRHVQPGLPAAVAGIKPGDRVLAVEGQKVRTFEELTERLGEKVGQETTVTVQRGEQTFDAKLEPKASFQSDFLVASSNPTGIQQFSPPAIIGVEPGTPAHEAGLRSHDRILSVNGTPIPDVLALSEAVAKTAEGDALSLEVLRVESLGLPGIAVNDPKTIEVSVPRQPGEGLSALGVDYSDLYLTSVIPGGPAARAGLKPGDRLVAVNGKKLTSFDGFKMALAQVKKDPFELEWRSGSETKKATLQIGEYEHRDPLGNPMTYTGVGVAASAMVGAQQLYVEEVTVTFGAGEAFTKSVRKLWSDITMVGTVLARLVTGDVSLNSMGGPIMMYQLASKTSELGFIYYFSLMAIISVNLGLMNLLPIPVLDGFALLSALWEGIRRRPIPMRVREVANMVGLAMLVILMVLVFKNDITR